ncbi:MAG TPA: CinA family protein [Eoetvoesiella sp.]
MDKIKMVACYMQSQGLVLATGESCTAGLIAATLADIPGAGELLDCAFVVYSPSAKIKCLGVHGNTISAFGLTSEEVSREMALGALVRGRANVAISNTGVTDFMENGPPAGTQCFAWAFKVSDAQPLVFSETRQFSGGRNEIRQASAEFALVHLAELHQQLALHTLKRAG